MARGSQEIHVAVAKLSDLLGDRLATGEAVRRHHGDDLSHHAAHLPDAVAFAASTGEVAQIVRICAEHHTPIVAFGTGTSLEAGVGIKGPTIIGENCEVRQGAYLRGNCILGSGCTIRGELKNVVLMDVATFPHPSYLGDGLCGYMTHFGNQGTAANLGIYEGVRERDKRQNIKLRVGGKTYDLGSPKMGVCLGDFSQVGCNSVTDPGTFLAPYTIVYALTRVNKGFYEIGRAHV